MNRKTRRRTFGKNWRMLVLGAALLNAPLLLSTARAQSDADIAAWKTEFQNAPKTNVASARTAYAALLDKLLPGMANADYDTRYRAQDAWEKIALNSARPGAESERAGAVQAMLAKIGADTPPIAREWLLKQLESIGRADAVPALTPLINDADMVIRNRALRGLAANSSPEAETALLNALQRATTPETRIAFINALAYRRSEAAVAPISALLTADEAVAMAAADALGNIGGTTAARSLGAARAAASPKLKIALLNNSIKAADSLAAAKKDAGAAAVYQEIWNSQEAPRFRVAALRGLAMTRGVEALPMVFQALGGDDAFLSTTAGRLLVDLPGAESGKAIARQLPGLQPAAQVSVIQALAERRDLASRPAVLALASSADQNVKLAALRALGVIGDASDTTMLAQLAATDKTPVGAAARSSLDRLPGEPANMAMVKLFMTATPEVRAELARSLAARRASSAATSMLASAETGNATERLEAIKALGVLGDEKVVPNLVKLLVKSPNDGHRDAARDALKDILDNRTQDKTIAGNALVAGLNGADPASKRALFTLMKSTGGEQTLASLLAATKDANPDVQDAAIRTLAQWPEGGAVPILSNLATTTPNLAYHTLALGGVVRLSAQPAFSTDERVKMLQSVLTTAKRPDEKRAALNALAKVVDPDALAAVRPLLDSADLKEEAALAAVSIGKSMGGDDVKAVMQQVIATSKNADTVKAATEVLNRPIPTVHLWQIVGPFPNADGSGFDKDFGLERTVDLKKAYTLEGNKKASFKTVTPNAETGYVNLLEQYDVKENAAAYGVIYVKSPTARPAHLTGGSDDGMKAWVNGKRVVSNNAARAANPNDEHADIQLKEGWNEILVKITQGSGDWGFYLDLQTPDKKPMTDLQWSARPN